MEQIVVYRKNGTERCNLRSNKNGIVFTDANRESVLMANDTVSVAVQSVNNIDFTVGDYIVVDGNVFRMNQAPKATRDERSIFVYDLTFESTKYDLANVMFLLPDSCVEDFLTANLKELVGIIVDNANRVYPNQWAKGYVPTDVEEITEQFTELNCLAALQSLCEQYGYEFRVRNADGVNIIDVKKQFGNTDIYLEYGRAKGLYSITREATASEEIMTRLYVYGSGENLPSGYPHSRLCLPYNGALEVNRRNVSFIESQSAVDRFGHKEGIVIFEDEKPNCKSEVTALSDDVKKFVDTDIDFDIVAYWQEDEFTEYCQIRGYDPNSEDVQSMFENDVVGKERKYIVDGKATIVFNTGDLAGKSFTLNNYDHATHTFTLDERVENPDDELLRQVFPNETMHQRKGDEYVISDIYLPYSKVEEAEDNLLQKANEYYAEHSKVCARYSIEFDAMYLKQHYPEGLIVNAGDFVHVKDNEIGINAWIKVTRYRRDLISGNVELEISDIKPRDPNIRYVSLYEGNDAVFEAEDLFGNHLRLTTLSSTFTPNYNGNTDTIIRSALTCGEGKFTNYTLEGKRRVWNLYNRVITGLIDSYAYDIYIKASKRTNDATVIACALIQPYMIEDTFGRLDFTNISVNDPSLRDNNYFYFKIGSLSKPTRRTSSMQRLRSLTLEYGNTRIAANDVVGGDIVIRDIDGVEIFNTATKSAKFESLKVRRGNVMRDVADVVQVENAETLARETLRQKDRALTSVMTPNYGADPARFNYTSGVYHNTHISDEGITDWKIIEPDEPIADIDPSIDYYIYVKANRNDENEAYIILSDEVIDEESLQDGYLYDMVGMLHSVSDYGNRLITTEIGGAEMNADFIIGGILRDIAGNEIIDAVNRRINGATLIKRANGTYAFSINEEVDSSRKARKAITGSETGTYNLKDADNNDTDIQTILGATPSTAGGLRKKVVDTETKVGDLNNGIIKKVNELVANMAELRRTFNGYHTNVCDDQRCKETETINLADIQPIS